MKALIVANLRDSQLGVLGSKLRDDGFCLMNLAREHPSSWPDLDGVDIVVCLGSDWSVYWPKVSASVVAESELILSSFLKGIPVFGICYGAQILAQTLGGAVYRSSQYEIGWSQVTSTDKHGVFDGTWFEWHFDSFVVPPKARLLASNIIGPQAFQIQNCLGTQFHPEVDMAILDSWVNASGGEELRGLGINPDDLIRISRGQVKSSRVSCLALIDWFLSSV